MYHLTRSKSSSKMNACLNNSRSRMISLPFLAACSTSFLSSARKSTRRIVRLAVSGVLGL
jgi:hypothetical protein